MWQWGSSGFVIGNVVRVAVFYPFLSNAGIAGDASGVAPLSQNWFYSAVLILGVRNRGDGRPEHLSAVN
jgi:hypothetical protein